MPGFLTCCHCYLIEEELFSMVSGRRKNHCNAPIQPYNLAGTECVYGAQWRVYRLFALVLFYFFIFTVTASLLLYYSLFTALLYESDDDSARHSFVLPLFFLAASQSLCVLRLM